MTDTDTDSGSLPREPGIRKPLKRYSGSGGIIMIMLLLLDIVVIAIYAFGANQTLRRKAGETWLVSKFVQDE